MIQGIDNLQDAAQKIDRWDWRIKNGRGKNASVFTESLGNQNKEESMEKLQNFLSCLGPGDYTLEMAAADNDSKTKFTHAYVLPFRIEGQGQQQPGMSGFGQKPMGNMVPMDMAEQWRQQDYERGKEEAMRQKEIEELRNEVQASQQLDPKLQAVFNVLENNADIIIQRLLGQKPATQVGTLNGQNQYAYQGQGGGEQGTAEQTEQKEQGQQQGERDLNSELEQIIEQQVQIVGSQEAYVDKMRKLTEKLQQNPSLLDLL